MRFVIFMAVLVLSGVSGAETAGDKPLDVGEGLQVTLNGGTVSLLKQGKPVWSRLVAHDVQPDSAATAEMFALQGDFQAIHTMVTNASGAVFEAVLTLKRGQSDIKLVWNERTDLRGDPGERTADAVRFEDLTSDKVKEIVVGKVSEAHRLCGLSELPLLFRKVFDFKTGAFRPILAKRPGLEPAVDLEGSPSATGAALPLIDQVTADAASRSAGDKSEVLFLGKPEAAVDKNPATLWTPGIGNGAGEFVSFHVASDVYGVTRLGIRSLPEVPGKVRYDRPQTLLLSTAHKSYRLVFKEDPALAAPGTTWFSLPAPDKTGCFSLTVEKTFDEASKAPLGLSEITVLTEIDEPGGLQRLAHDLNNAARRRQAAMLLTSAGDRAGDPIRKEWRKLNTFGRRLAVQVLSRTGAEAAMDLLAESAVSTDPLTREAAIEGLKIAPEKAVLAMEPHLFAKDDKIFSTAAETLALLGTREAVNALAAKLGKTNRNRRGILVGLISTSLRDTPEDTDALWAQVQDAAAQKETDRLFALLQVAATFSSLEDRVFETAGPLFDGATTFPDRYRLLEVLGAVSCGRGLERLSVAAADGDLQIRAAAVRGIGQCLESDGALGAVLNSLKDAEPTVRLAALDALYRGRLSNLSVPFEQLSRPALRDPWPKVRARAVRLSSVFPRDKVMGLLQQAAQDPSPDVRETALFAVFQYFGKDADAVIEARLSAENETDKLKSAAAAAAGKRCQKTALPALFELLKKGAEPLAEAGAVETAVAAARAIGDIGTQEAVSMLKEAAKRSNISTDKAIDAALKNPGAACDPSKTAKQVGPVGPRTGEAP